MNNSVTGSTSIVSSSTSTIKYKILFTVIAICSVALIIYFGTTWVTHTGSSSSPDIMLINGTINAQTPVVISQSLSQNSNMIVSPSRNQPGGLEFTWSVWLNISSLESSTLFSNVFFKGAYTNNRCSNINDLTNGPGVYLLNNSETSSATLYIVMDTFTSPGGYVNGLCDISNSIQIPHIPMKEWIHLCIGCHDRDMTIYINGTVVNSTRLVGIPKQNNGDIFIAHNKGFDGKISTLQYLPRTLSVSQIIDIYQKGPIKTPIVPVKPDSTSNDYLAFNWYVK
jgi:hypothetical protein